MGFLDNAKDKLSKAVDKHGDKIAGGIDKAASLADQKTKGKYSEKIDTGAAKAKQSLEKRNGRNDGTNDGTNDGLR